MADVTKDIWNDNDGEEEAKPKKKSGFRRFLTFALILESGNRTLAGPTVPPGGLYLTKLWYEDERLNGE